MGRNYEPWNLKIHQVMLSMESDPVDFACFRLYLYENIKFTILLNWITGVTIYNSHLIK